MKSSSILCMRWTPSFPAQASKLSLNGYHENGNAPGLEGEKKHFGGKSVFFSFRNSSWRIAAKLG